MAQVKSWLGWLILVFAAGAALWLMRSLYEGEVNDPWTRDGLVQADLVLVASPLSGGVGLLCAALAVALVFTLAGRGEA